MRMRAARPRSQETPRRDRHGKSCGQHTRFPEGASPVSDPHRPYRGAGACFPRDPFLREGALMAHFRCPVARMPAPETAR